MELFTNVKSVDDGLEGQVFFSLFDKYIDFSAYDSTDIEYVTRCAGYLNALSEPVVGELCRASIRYCNDFLNAVGEKEREFEDDRDVLGLIYPAALIVPNPENGDEPVIHLELNCVWEEEHGMEWVVRGDKVLYVGGFNDEDPRGDYSEKESWNYAWRAV